MDTVEFTWILIAVIFYTNYGEALNIRQQASQNNASKCAMLSKDPYFDIEQVVGKSWRIYYTWKVNMEYKCLDMTFKVATPMVTNRIYNDMNEYLEQQPNWDAATLYVTMGTAKHELLLFAEQGAAGIFAGVPNVLRDGNMVPARRVVPLLKFFLKLLDNGNYLLMSDCNIGVTSLSGRDKPPDRVELTSIANSLPLGLGGFACISDKKHDEQMFV